MIHIARLSAKLSADTKDLLDVAAKFARKMIEAAKLSSLFALIEPFLYKYPAIDPTTFAHSVHLAIDTFKNAPSQ